MPKLVPCAASATCAFARIATPPEIITRLTTDTTLVQTVVGSSASVTLRNMLIVIGATVMMAITSTKLTLMALAIIPLVLVPILAFGRRVRRLSRESQDRVADVGAYVDESLGAIRTVQAFTHEDLDRSRFAARVEEAFDVAIRRTSMRAILTAIVILLVFGSVALVLWIGGHDMLAGKISPGALSSFVFYAILAASSAGAISEVIGDLQRAKPATSKGVFIKKVTLSTTMGPGIPVDVSTLPE